MMIVRATAKLNKKIHVMPAQVLPLAENPYADWSARLFMAGRTQYIICTNTASLYSALIPGRGITDEKSLIPPMLAAIREQMDADGLLFLFERLIAPAAKQVIFSKTLNSSVTGSMNDLVLHAQYSLTDGGRPPFYASRLLVRTPMGALRYAFPVEVFANMEM